MIDEKIIENFLASGFAVLVTGFVLLRLEREIKELRNAIEKLARCQVCIVEAKIKEDK